MSAKSLEQLKIDVKRNGWPWPIEHPNDERALLDGCYPDFQAAERVRNFFKKCLFLPKRQRVDEDDENQSSRVQPFHLLDWWYRDIIAQLFGWKQRDGRRRYDKGFITTAKKSAKSTVLAGLPLYMILADGEEEAEAYSAAVDRDQASLIFVKTLRAVRLSPYLKKICREQETKKIIRHDASGSWYEAISSDADSTEGKNPHLLIVDEAHVVRDRQFIDSLMYGDIVRSQPLLLFITTAGDDEQTVGFEEYEAAKALLNPNDPYYVQSVFAYIAEASDPQAWDDPKSWLEANPSLRGEVDDLRPRQGGDLPATPRVIGSIEKLHAKLLEAKQTPRKKRKFIRYICNRWIMESEETWLDPDSWDLCGDKIPSHIGEPCWCGLDLSTHRDLTALCLAFWNDDDGLDLLWKFWTPKARLKKHEDEWRVPLRMWVEDGWVEATDGEKVDYAYVRRAISGAMFNPDGSRRPDTFKECVANQYSIQEIAFDNWNATELCENELFEADGIPVLMHSQGIALMNEPSKRFETMLQERKIRHGNNPVATWQSRHVIAPEDANGNIKPHKKKSRWKVDGIVAAVMAVGRATKNVPQESYYESHPLEMA